MRISELPFQRILILTQYFHPETGAPSIRLRAMCKELRAIGMNVQVITGMPNYPTGKIHPQYRGLFFYREMIDEIPVSRVWLFPAAGRHVVRRLINYLSFTITSCILLLFVKGVDLVFVEAQPITLAIPAYLNSLICNTPYVYNTPDLQIEFAHEDQWIGTRWLISAAKHLESFLMHKALCVTTVTKAFIDYFVEKRGMSRSKIAFLPNGADIERLKPLPYDKEYAKIMGVNGRKVFTYAGTHATYQGLDLIIDAAALLKNRKDIVILLVGDGPEKSWLIERVKREGIDNVLFKVSPFSEMHSLMAITRAFIVVLRGTDVSKKMRLAKTIPPLACGVPLVYAGWGESAEIVVRERVGLVVEPGNPQALASAIEKMADDEILRSEMGKRGRSLAEQNFSWKHIVNNWVSQMVKIYGDSDVH